MWGADDGSLADASGPAGGSGGRPNNKRDRRRNGGTDIGAAAGRMSAAECVAAHAALLARQSSAGCRTTTAARISLPIAPFRDQILAAVASSQVVIIAGETGCGKTTQVPQYLLEQSWATGVPARIICTQPRRISAITVAERVASERGEGCGSQEGSVGYSIRLETRAHGKTALLFCTNGVLLRKLTNTDGDGPGGSGGDPLEGVTHIVVDEIHERDLFADFLMVVLRDLLPRRPSLRVVLMSATLNEDLFSGYFVGAPVIRVPGFTHPVIEYHLEDILPALGYGADPSVAQRTTGSHSEAAAGGPAAPPSGPQWVPAVAAVAAAIESAFLHGTDEAFERLLEASTSHDGHVGLVNVAHAATGVTPLHAAAAKGRDDVAFALIAAGADVLSVARDGSTPAAFARRFNFADLADTLEAHGATITAAKSVAERQLILSTYQRTADPDSVDLDLLERLLLFIHLHRGSAASIGPNAPGAVLVFLPGWDEITRMRERLLAHPVLGSKGTALVLPLHSMVPPADQRLVFARAPPGVRKFVLATNIAETAVTVDDVTCVIDCGRHKERSYDAYAGVATLQAAWISQASATQRRGRAGRCRPGECYRLYSVARLASLQKFQLPEMQRSPLEELCLQVKVLQHDCAATGVGGTRAAEFLSRAVEPPQGPAVDAAVALLTDIGALSPEDEQLTPLGKHLAALPLHPRVGKMLLFGALLGCLDPVLTVAAAGTGRSPFVTPVDANARRQADGARRGFADLAGGGSDHLATVAAFNAWEEVRSHRAGLDAWCSRNYVSPGTMHMVSGLRAQLSGALAARGIVATTLGSASGAAPTSSDLLRTAPGLVRAVLGAGMYPLVGTLMPGKGNPKPTVATLKGEKVRIHPSSVNGGKAPADAGGDEAADGGEDGKVAPRIVAFEEMQRGEAFTFIRDCTLVAPHILLLVCARLGVQDDLVVQGGDDGDGDDGDAMDVAPAPSADTALMVVDNWLRFRVPLPQVAQLCTLRLRLAAAFAARVQRAHEALDAPLAAAVHAAAQLLAAETGGFVAQQAPGGAGPHHGMGGPRFHGRGGGGGGGGRFGRGARHGPLPGPNRGGRGGMPAFGQPPPHGRPPPPHGGRGQGRNDRGRGPAGYGRHIRFQEE